MKFSEYRKFCQKWDLEETNYLSMIFFKNEMGL
jgi:hypothetical protein